MSEWSDMLTHAKTLGINPAGMKRPDLEAAISAALHDPESQTPGPPVVRTNHAGAWWCPDCDHSQTKDYVACQGCGKDRPS
jgi:hypothetical protein